MDQPSASCRSLLEHLNEINDPGIANQCEHRLVDMMTIALCAVVCGADDWNAIESFGKAKKT